MSPARLNVNPSSEKEGGSKGEEKDRLRDDNLLYNGQKNCIWRAIKNFNYYFKTLNVMLRTSMHKNRLVFYVPGPKRSLLSLVRSWFVFLVLSSVSIFL